MSTAAHEELDVVHDEEASRYVLRRAGLDAGFIAYAVRDDGVVVIRSTQIDPNQRGRGLGELLVRDVLDALRADDRRIGSHCWFVDDFVRAHPDYEVLLAG